MFFGVRTISERVVVRIGVSDKTWLIEMNLDEAKLFAIYLDRAIEKVETGSSVANDFGSFLHTLPGYEGPID